MTQTNEPAFQLNDVENSKAAIELLIFLTELCDYKHNKTAYPYDMLDTVSFAAGVLLSGFPGDVADELLKAVRVSIQDGYDFGIENGYPKYEHINAIFGGANADLNAKEELEKAVEEVLNLFKAVGTQKVS
jgi:hypothetical protein